MAARPPRALVEIADLHYAGRGVFNRSRNLISLGSENQRLHSRRYAE